LCDRPPHAADDAALAPAQFTVPAATHTVEAAWEIRDAGVRPLYFDRGETELALTGRIRATAVRHRERIAADNEARAQEPA
jgi:hypothetical protein